MFSPAHWFISLAQDTVLDSRVQRVLHQQLEGGRHYWLSPGGTMALATLLSGLL